MEGWYIMICIENSYLFLKKNDMWLKIPNEVKCISYYYCETNNVIWEWMVIYFILFFLKSVVSMLVARISTNPPDIYYFH